ncbi:MAG: DNA polymerase/3'-5' exonuclease PolX [Gemmataceae bacterium]
MNKNDIAAILDEMGTLMELHGENPFRCKSYKNGAHALSNLDRDLAEVISAGELGDIPGIGSSMQRNILSLVKTGELKEYTDLKAKTPPGLLEMLRIPGLGPKKIKVLYQEMDLDTIDKLKAACEDGIVAKKKGFGAKTQQKILEGIEFLGQVGNRLRIDQAMYIGEMILEELRKCPEIIRMEVCGSLRRRRETAKDIDILVSSNEPEPIMEVFVNMPLVMKVTSHGETKSSVIVSEGAGHSQIVMNADLRIVKDEVFPFALHYFTGSKEHNIAMRSRAIEYGLKLNEYGLEGEGKSVTAKDEADIFKALDLSYIPPAMRENTGEIEASLQDALPTLLTEKDITGVFHNHTVYSDGKHTVEEMALAAKKLGMKYLGLADHSQSLTIANGLSPERVLEQQKEIDEVNKKLKGITVFKGIECDILEDGSLDYDDELLSTFDYVVASVHTHFNQSEEAMTERVIRAMKNPYVTMLGHATGRLILRREGYKINLEAVLEAAGETGTMVEINAQPSRLDLDWVHCKRAKKLGVPLVINPDAHSTGELGLFRFGVYVAQRGWLDKADVFNTKTLAQVKKGLAAKRKAMAG